MRVETPPPGAEKKYATSRYFSPLIPNTPEAAQSSDWFLRTLGGVRYANYPRVPRNPGVQIAGRWGRVGGDAYAAMDNAEENSTAQSRTKPKKRLKKKLKSKKKPRSCPVFPLPLDCAASALDSVPH